MNSLTTRCRVPVTQQSSQHSTLGPNWSTRGDGDLRLEADKPRVQGERVRVQALSHTHPDFDCQSIRFAPEALTRTFNDPSAGSPTETLLRLLLPLSATVWTSFRQLGSVNRQASNPRSSLKHSIGSSDGRCVQRAGT